MIMKMTSKPRAENGRATASLPELMTLAEAAAVARVAKSTVARACRRGELRVFRTLGGGVIRVYADSLREYIAAHSYGGR